MNKALGTAIVLILVGWGAAIAEERLLYIGPISTPLVVFETPSAKVFDEGSVWIKDGVTVEVAATEVSRNDVFCDSLKSVDHADSSMVEFSVTLNQLNNYHWQIDLKPNGAVVYDNIQPSDKAKAYFSALAKHLACN